MFPKEHLIPVVSWLTEWIRRSAQRVETTLESPFPKPHLLFRMHRLSTGYSRL